MDDERIERLLKGYRLPDVSPDLDHRVLGEGAAVMARARFRATVEDIGRTLLHRLGFGYVAWVVDLVTTTDAEYRVDLI
jgi:hypothetical protein